MIEPEAPISESIDAGPVVESFLARLRKGERPAITDLMARHPEIADQLREIIPALVELEQLGDMTGSFSGARQASHAPIGADHPARLGDYRILRRIGGGGMGVVYEAEHNSLKSRVALKVMHPRFRADAKSIDRFHLEARSAAGLHHTNIVSVFDYGEDGGVCYYAMQYIRGQPLDCVLEDLRRLRADDGSAPATSTALLTQGIAGEGSASNSPRTVAQGLMTGRFTYSGQPPTDPEATGPIVMTRATPEGNAGDDSIEPREAPSFGSKSLGDRVEGRYYREVARVCAQVADALEYAHQAGVLHRDIKPPNLLLDAAGNVWVTDFGLAKLLDGADSSQSQDLVGTIRYMAPERFRGISNRSGDLYALGATLYELITLRPAFDGTDQVRLIDRIIHESPEPPRLIDRRIPRDLETIVLKSLAKDPKDRFGTAREMADELKKFVSGLPIRSRPISFPERFWRWCKRNPGLATANIAAAVTTIALAIGSTIAAKVYHDDRERIATIARVLAKSEIKNREELFESRTSQARASRFSRQVGQRFGSLDALTEAVKIGQDLRYPAARFDRLRDEAIACLMLPDLKPAGPPIPIPQHPTCFAQDDAMSRYAVRNLDGSIFVRKFADNAQLARFTADGDRDIWLFLMSLDGKFLLSQDGPAISVWDVDRATLVLKCLGVAQSFTADFDPKSRRVAIALDGGTILIHDLTTGASTRWEGFPEIGGLRFRPDGSELAVLVGVGPATCRILDAKSGREVRSLAMKVGGEIAWSRDGSTLVRTETRKKPSLHDSARGDLKVELDLPPQMSHGLRAGFDPGGTLVATNDWNTRLRLWDVSTGRERLSMDGLGHPLFTRDGRILLERGSELAAWQIAPGDEVTTLRYPADRNINHARPSVHPDGRILSVGTEEGVIFWDLARKSSLGILAIGNAWHSAFTPSGDLITNGSSGLIQWPVRREPDNSVIKIGPPRFLPAPGTHCAIDFDRTGRVIAIAAKESVFVVMPKRTIEIHSLDDCRGVSVSPDGQWLSTNNHQRGGVSLFSLPDGKLARKLVNDGPGRSSFSPNGRWIALTEMASTRLVEVGTWRELRRIEGNFQCFTPDGSLGIVQDQSNVEKLVDLESGKFLARFERPDQLTLRHLTFSPDGSRLIGTTNDTPCAQVIDLRLIRKHLASMGLDYDAPAFRVDDPARSDLAPLPPIKFDRGAGTSDPGQVEDTPGTELELLTARVKAKPGDAESYYVRAMVLAELNRPTEAIDDISQAIRLSPFEVKFLLYRAHLNLDVVIDLDRAVSDLETALAIEPSSAMIQQRLSLACNNLAWALALGTPSRTNLDRSVKLSERALRFAPGRSEYLNTRGVVLYRAGRLDEAVSVLNQSLVAGKGRSDGFDLFALAMIHHKLDHRDEARRCLDRAIEWSARARLPVASVRELADLRAEAEASLAGPAGELPRDVFAPIEP